MNYGDILNYTFKTDDNKIFAINQFDKISNYITKYPNQKYFLQEKTIAFFWTMRDINALKRTKTFIATENVNTIRVSLENLHYYCYIDIFKEYIKNIPYYFGNCDVFINNDDFLKIKDIFIDKSLSKYDFLSHLIAKPNKNYDLIDKYFKKLIGEHYVY